MKNPKVSAIPIALALFLISCGPIGADPIEVLDHTGSAVQRITGGTAPPDDAPHYAAVVALLQKQGPFYFFFCSGTLISPQVVLTAGHCLQDGRGNPRKLFVLFGDTVSGATVGDLRTVSQTETNPGYSTAPVFGFVNDIALIRLAEPADGIAHVPHLPMDAATDNLIPGKQVNFAGFGEDSQGNSGVKLQVGSEIGGVTNPCTVPGSDPFSCLTHEGSQVWYAQNSGQGGPCFGDSGGPMFLSLGSSGMYVAGVTSYGDSTCSVYGVSTRPDAFECWIDNFVVPGSCNDNNGGSGICGDGQIDAGEDCDGTDLNAQTCISLGLEGSGLTCSASCTFDTSACTPPSCTPAGASCTSDSECCTNRCKGKPDAKICKE